MAAEAAGGGPKQKEKEKGLNDGSCNVASKFDFRNDTNDDVPATEPSRTSLETLAVILDVGGDRGVVAGVRVGVRRAEERRVGSVLSRQARGRLKDVPAPNGCSGS